jgi:sugar phosphate isomerase/epimerase
MSNELSTPEKLMELLRAGHFTDVGVCFDVGHAHLEQGIPQAFEVLKDRICSTHVHDNHKERDEHLWPADGTIDWAETVSLLRSAPNVPPLLLEIEAIEGQKVSRKMIAVFEKLETVAAPTA